MLNTVKSAVGGNKKLWAAIGGTAILAATALPALAAEESVTATVTPILVAVSVDDGGVAYGLVNFTESNDTLDGSAAETQVIINDGNVSIDLDLKSSDATATTTWSLVSAVPGTDEFRHQYDIDGTIGSAVWADFPSNNGFIGSSVGTLATNGSTANLDLRITMPSTSADTSQHSITVTVRATET